MSIALIGGAGEGLGAALGRRFSQSHEVVLSSRTRGERADLRDERQVIDLFERVETRGPIEVAIFNAGTHFRGSILETPAQTFEEVWRLGCYAGFLFGREAARRMVPRGRGTILFTGATASLRGSANFAAFAAAKGGLRQVAQSMARELGPKDIHVAHIVIDGRIDAMGSDAIAELYWQLHAQPRSAWTFEADLRPASEKF